MLDQECTPTIIVLFQTTIEEDKAIKDTTCCCKDEAFPVARRKLATTQKECEEAVTGDNKVSLKEL